MASGWFEFADASTIKLGEDGAATILGNEDALPRSAWIARSQRLPMTTGKKRGGSEAALEFGWSIRS
ncbi:hypothetical protein [Fulvimarina endophytica]|uniref:hypothetical protein n=1 Tax=Fulvimarina endophytica TaxID=2293836 RepID=UPI001313E5D2|nr:hypothetical protein [Fulvimarina endophytica]